nr:bifunctional nuclease family protein [Chloroflexota bacterium]
MITAIVHSIRASLLSNHRVVLLKDVNAERYLPIWIGPFEAEAIALALQHIEPPRPMTHDLLKAMIVELGGTVSYILINALVDNTFHGRIVVEIGGRQTEVDSRPSDAIALAVRCNAPIYVAEEVMAQASIVPSPEVEPTASVEPVTPEEEENLSVFREFLESLDSEEEQKDE